MTAEEMGKVMHVLKAAYPNFYSRMSADEQRDIFGLWLDMFKGDDAVMVGMAVKALIATDTRGFPPVIGQVKEKMRMLQSTDELTEGEAWTLVKKALRNGYYGADEEFSKLPDNIKAIVGSPNQLKEWALMPTEEVDSVVASNFQRGYRNYQGRTHEMQMLPEGVKNFVAQISSRMAMPALPE